MDKCQICNSKSEHTHHIKEQNTADKNGIIDNHHKNINHNLVQLCESCHHKVHNENLRIYGYHQTDKGIVLNYEYIDINGDQKILNCDGLLSTCLQHEINHLDGKLIIDYLSKLKRDIIIKKISKTKKNPDRILV